MSDRGMRQIEDRRVAEIGRRITEIRLNHIWTDRTPLTDVSVAETMDHLTPAEARRLRYRRAPDGLRWGKPWSTAWFRLRLRIPPEFRGEAVSLIFKTGGECIIFRNDVPVQALDLWRDEYLLLDRARGGERIELTIEAGANEAWGKFETRTMLRPCIAVFNRDVWDAYWDLCALHDMVNPNAAPRLRMPKRFAMEEDDTRRRKCFSPCRRRWTFFTFPSPPATRFAPWPELCGEC